MNQDSVDLAIRVDLKRDSKRQLRREKSVLCRSRLSAKARSGLQFARLIRNVPRTRADATKRDTDISP
jgi:hypothetical protein